MLHPHRLWPVPVPRRWTVPPSAWRMYDVTIPIHTENRLQPVPVPRRWTVPPSAWRMYDVTIPIHTDFVKLP